MATHVLHGLGQVLVFFFGVWFLFDPIPHCTHVNVLHVNVLHVNVLTYSDEEQFQANTRSTGGGKARHQLAGCQGGKGKEKSGQSQGKGKVCLFARPDTV